MIFVGVFVDIPLQRIEKQQISMDDSRSIMEIIFWVIVGTDCIWMPIVGYHWYIYWLKRNESFFYKRMSTTTLIITVYLYIIIIHRIYYAATGLGYLPNIWELYRLFSYMTSFPLQGLCLYKLNTYIYTYTMLICVC